MSQKYQNCKIKERVKQKRGVFQMKKENVFFTAFVVDGFSFFNICV